MFLIRRRVSRSSIREGKRGEVGDGGRGGEEGGRTESVVTGEVSEDGEGEGVGREGGTKEGVRGSDRSTGALLSFFAGGVSAAVSITSCMKRGSDKVLGPQYTHGSLHSHGSCRLGEV